MRDGACLGNRTGASLAHRTSTPELNSPAPYWGVSDTDAETEAERRQELELGQPASSREKHPRAIKEPWRSPL